MVLLNPPKQTFHRQLVIGVITASVGGVFVLAAAWIQGKRSADPAANPTPVQSQVANPATPQPQVLSLEVIMATLDSTPQLRQSAAFDALFAGREVVSRGIVHAVYETQGDENNDHKHGFVVELSSLKGYSPRQISYFDTSWREALSALKKGDTVQVSGIATGVWLSLQFVYTKSSKLSAR